MRRAYGSAGCGPASTVSVIARYDLGAGLGDRSEAVTAVVEVALPIAVRTAEHAVAVELEVHDRPVHVGRVEGHRGVVGHQDAGRGRTSRGRPSSKPSMRTWSGTSSCARSGCRFGCSSTATVSPWARGHRLELGRPDDGQPAAGELGRGEALRVDDVVASLLGRAHQPASPGRREQDQVAPLRRDALAFAEQGVESRHPGEPGLARAVAVGRAVSDDCFVLTRRAGDDEVDLLGVEPSRQVVLRHAVTEEGEPPAGGRPRGGPDAAGRTIGVSACEETRWTQLSISSFQRSEP